MVSVRLSVMFRLRAGARASGSVRLGLGVDLRLGLGLELWLMLGLGLVLVLGLV